MAFVVAQAAPLVHVPLNITVPLLVTLHVGFDEKLFGIQFSIVEELERLAPFAGELMETPSGMAVKYLTITMPEPPEPPAL